MTLDLRSAIGGLALAAGLGFMGTAPFVADYVVIACGLVGLGVAAFARGKALPAPATVMVYAALLLLAATLPFVYRSSLDLLPLAACLPMLAAPGIAVLLERDGPAPRWLGAHALPLLCLFGAATAVAAGAWEATYRPGRIGVGNNPIHYGGIITILGFLALTGMVSNTARWRFIYLAGPVLAMLGVIMSGSRGPLLAWFALALISLPILLIGLKNWRLALVTILVTIVGGALFVSLAGDSQVVARLLRTSDSFASVLSANDPAALIAFLNANDQYRSGLYDTGWQGFSQSPIHGIGFGQVMPLARELYPELKPFLTLENLHSDIADFAALGGVMGLAAYLLILFSPVAALKGLRMRDTPGLWLAAAVLIVGYATLGLTNAMFGVLPQTALFAAALGCLMALGHHARVRNQVRPEPRR